MSVGHGVLFSAGNDLAVRSWHLESLEEIGCVSVSISLPLIIIFLTLAKAPVGVPLYNYYALFTTNMPPSRILVSPFTHTQKAHDGLASAMTCSKHYLFISFLGCIKVCLQDEPHTT